MPAKTAPQIESVVFSPPQVAEKTIGLVRKLQEKQAGGLVTGIADIDAKLIPLRSGLVTVIGCTSHYKSSFMNFIIHSNLPKMEPGEVIVKFTWEQSVEKDTLSWMSHDANLSITQLARGDVDEAGWKVLMSSYARRAIAPLWVCGHSVTSEGVGTVRPRMSMDDVYKACSLIRHGASEEDHTIRAIFLDYLQRVPPRPQDGSDKRLQMMATVDAAADLGIYYDCPVFLGNQAKRDVLSRENKLPRADDGQETSNAEQSSTGAIFSLWMPSKTEKPGTMVNGYPVNPNLLVVGLLKQPLGPAPEFFYLHVDPEHNKIAGLTKPEEKQERKVYRG
jgi:replicative DNA helicase